jgi:hypothetical protein
MATSLLSRSFRTNNQWAETLWRHQVRLHLPFLAPAPPLLIILHKPESSTDQEAPRPTRTNRKMGRATCPLQPWLRRNVKLSPLILQRGWLCSSCISLSAFPTDHDNLTVLHHAHQTKVETNRIVTHLFGGAPDTKLNATGLTPRPG